MRVAVSAPSAPSSTANVSMPRAQSEHRAAAVLDQIERVRHVDVRGLAVSQHQLPEAAHR